MAKLRHIALLIGQDLSFCRDVIRGIRAYALRKSDWAIRNGPPDVEIIPSLREWNPPGSFPIRVVARQSTDVLASGDPVVIAALRYIHSAAIEGINVAGVVQATGAGRRELERKFRAILGRSVLQELRRVRIQQAQKLLGSVNQ